MAKQKAELAVAFEVAGAVHLLLKVVVQGFDLYEFNHLPAAAGKTSHHESGLTHGHRSILNTLNLRQTDQRGASLKTLAGIRQLSGFTGSDKIGEMTGFGALYAVKADTKTRKTLLMPAPPHIWGVNVWAFPRGHVIARDTVLSTRPWPSVPVTNHLIADWIEPNILITVWASEDRSPYKVVRYRPAVKGYVPFELFPEEYEGTPLYSTVHARMDPFRRAMRERIIADTENSDDGDE